MYQLFVTTFRYLLPIVTLWVPVTLTARPTTGFGDGEWGGGNSEREQQNHAGLTSYAKKKKPIREERTLINRRHSPDVGVGGLKMQTFLDIRHKHTKWVADATSLRGRRVMPAFTCAQLNLFPMYDCIQLPAVITVLGKTALSEGLVYFGSVTLSYINLNR